MRTSKRKRSPVEQNEVPRSRQFLSWVGVVLQAERETWRGPLQSGAFPKEWPSCRSQSTCSLQWNLR